MFDICVCFRSAPLYIQKQWTMWKFANFLIKMIFGMSKSFCRSTILAYSDIRITVSSISVQPFISFRLFRRVQFRNRVTFKFHDNIFKLFILLLHTLSLSLSRSLTALLLMFVDVKQVQFTINACSWHNLTGSGKWMFFLLIQTNRKNQICKNLDWEPIDVHIFWPVYSQSRILCVYAMKKWTNPMWYDLRQTAAKMCEICSPINWKEETWKQKLA